MGRRRGRRRHRQRKPIAVLYSWRNDETNRMAADGLSAALARHAWIGPDFSAPAASTTELAHRHVERHGNTRKRLPRRQVQLGQQPARAIAFRRRRDEARAHPFDSGVQRWKIDRDFVVEPSVPARERHREHAFRGASVVTRANGIVPHRLRYDRVATPPCQGKRRVLASARDHGTARMSSLRRAHATAHARADRSRARYAPGQDHRRARVGLPRVRPLRGRRRILK